MYSYRISEVAEFLGVSDDTVRRWVDEGHLPVDDSQQRPLRIAGVQLVKFLNNSPQWQQVTHSNYSTHSTRNQLTGIITNIISDTVMSQVELQCGRTRIVSLISTESVVELGLEVGAIATAQIKSTNVSIITQ